jgi:hypothetical protein
MTIGETILMTVVVTGAGACFLGYFVFAWLMWRGRKPHVTVADVGWNQFNICFLPSLLTEDGLRARKWFFLSFLGLLAFIGVPGLLAVFTK